MPLYVNTNFYFKMLQLFFDFYEKIHFSLAFSTKSDTKNCSKVLNASLNMGNGYKSKGFVMSIYSAVKVRYIYFSDSICLLRKRDIPLKQTRVAQEKPSYPQSNTLVFDFVVERTDCRILIRNYPYCCNTEGKSNKKVEADEAEGKAEVTPSVTLHNSLGLSQSLFRGEVGIVCQNVMYHRVVEGHNDTGDDEEKGTEEDTNAHNNVHPEHSKHLTEVREERTDLCIAAGGKHADFYKFLFHIAPPKVKSN